jgi:hypothetical protein
VIALDAKNVKYYLKEHLNMKYIKDSANYVISLIQQIFKLNILI